MRTNRSIPPVTVVPMLAYPDVRAAVEWLSDVFGFVERTRIGEDHRSQMSIGSDGAVIVGDVHGARIAPTPGATTQITRVRVADANQFFARVRDRIKGRGGEILAAPTDREYGERDFLVEDLAGHRWEFCESLRDVAPEEYGCETVSPWPRGERPQQRWGL
ncbi:MAG TPA: VOC family protein [Solirubrobacteraceae bacterium]|nr:VOC family protein [Solirubrobacteraceae bacterium]